MSQEQENLNGSIAKVQNENTNINDQEQDNDISDDKNDKNLNQQILRQNSQQQQLQNQSMGLHDVGSNQIVETFNANDIDNNNISQREKHDNLQDSQLEQTRNNQEYLNNQKMEILGIFGQANCSNSSQTHIQEKQKQISSRLEQKFQTLFKKIENKSPQKREQMKTQEIDKKFASPYKNSFNENKSQTGIYKQFSNSNKNAQNLSDLAQNFNNLSSQIQKQQISEKKNIVNEIKQNSTIQFQLSPNKKNFRVENQESINSLYSTQKEDNSDKSELKSNLQILLLKSKNDQQFNENSYRSPIKTISARKLGDFSSPQINKQSLDQQQQENLQNSQNLQNQEDETINQQRNGYYSTISKLSQQKSPGNNFVHSQHKSPSFLERSKISSAKKLFTGNSNDSDQENFNNFNYSQQKSQFHNPLNILNSNFSNNYDKQYIIDSDLEKKNLFEEVQQHIFARKNNFKEQQDFQNKREQNNQIFRENDVSIKKSRNTSQQHLQLPLQIVRQKSSSQNKFVKNFAPNSGNRFDLNLNLKLNDKKSSSKKQNIQRGFLSPQRAFEQNNKNKNSININDEIFQNRNKSTTNYGIQVVSTTGKVIQNDQYNVQENNGKISLSEFQKKKTECEENSSKFQRFNCRDNVNNDNNFKNLLSGIWQKKDQSKEENQLSANFVKDNSSPLKLIKKKSTLQMQQKQEQNIFNDQWNNVVKDFGFTGGNQQSQQKSHFQDLKNLDLNELYQKKLQERQNIKKQAFHFKNDQIFDQKTDNQPKQNYFQKQGLKYLNKQESQSNRLLEEIGNTGKCSETKSFFRKQDNNMVQKQESQKTFFKPESTQNKFSKENIGQSNKNQSKFTYFQSKKSGLSDLEDFLNDNTNKFQNYRLNQNRSQLQRSRSKLTQKQEQNKNSFKNGRNSKSKSQKNIKMSPNNFSNLSPYDKSKKLSFAEGFKVKTKNLENYERDFNNYRNISDNNSFYSNGNMSPVRDNTSRILKNI